MKRFFTVTMEIKSNVALIFCGYVLAYVAVGWLFFDLKSIGFGLLLQFLCMSAVAGSLQYVVFSGNVIKKMRYPLRVALFFLPLYLLVSGFALGFGWFPISFGSWAVFTAIFVAIFLIVTAVFEMYYRIVGARYQARLDAYKAKQAE